MATTIVIFSIPSPSLSLRCKKNHPKGDGNSIVISFIIVVLTNVDSKMMQKESPKKGMAT